MNLILILMFKLKMSLIYALCIMNCLKDVFLTSFCCRFCWYYKDDFRVINLIISKLMCVDFKMSCNLNSQFVQDSRYRLWAWSCHKFGNLKWNFYNSMLKKTVRFYFVSSTSFEPKKKKFERRLMSILCW